MLRGKPPEPVNKRLKLFMFSPAGFGKTTASIQFPRAYIIDAERGTENYADIIRERGSVVFPTNDMNDVVAEVRSLQKERHDYRTLVIDPITTLYDDLLEKSEAKVGSAHGRHYGEASKLMKRLANLILALDMNVIVTAHAKPEYGKNMEKLGYTFDGWKQLDYMFDLVVELQNRGNKRFGRVVKTRVATFPDDDVFEWSYESIKARWDASLLEREADAVELASPEQVGEIKALLSVVRLPDGLTDTWFEKAGVDAWEDMPAPILAKCIEYVRARVPQMTRTPGRAPAPRAPDPAPSSALEQQLRDSVAFQERWNEATQARGFDQAMGRALLNEVLRRHHKPSLAETDADWRNSIIVAVESGTFDHLRVQRGSELEGKPQEQRGDARRDFRADDVRSYEQFVEHWNEGAQLNGWTPTQAERALRMRLMSISKVGKGETTTLEWRLGSLRYLYDNAIDVETGRNRAAEPAASGI